MNKTKFVNEIWAFIPARAGSSLKDKNIRKLNGKPLIYWTIKAAKKTNLFSNVYVDTDCNKIKKNLSWVCQYDFKQSLSDTIDWYFKKSD